MNCLCSRDLAVLVVDRRAAESDALLACVVCHQIIPPGFSVTCGGDRLAPASCHVGLVPSPLSAAAVPRPLETTRTARSRLKRAASFAGYIPVTSCPSMKSECAWAGSKASPQSNGNYKG